MNYNDDITEDKDIYAEESFREMMEDLQQIRNDKEKEEEE